MNGRVCLHGTTGEFAHWTETLEIYFYFNLRIKFNCPHSNQTLDFWKFYDSFYLRATLFQTFGHFPVVMLPPAVNFNCN